MTARWSPLRVAAACAFLSFFAAAPVLLYLREAKGVDRLLGNPVFTWMLLPLMLALLLLSADRAAHRKRHLLLGALGLAAYLAMFPALNGLR